tara:strand:- start:268 stop:1575 length:1308 start_codon:yes stop_codon:yes gene_type:complete
MTYINSIPKREPKISIGLVLPEDRKTNLIVTIFSSKYLLFFDQEKIDFDQNELSIDLSPNGILVNNKSYKEIHIKNKSRDLSDYIYLDNVIAGRGFHWQKSISIKVLGDLHISYHKSYLFAINKLYLEDYLMCVATSEMSGNCPAALLESQTIAARSWILAAAEKKHKDLNIDACNDDCCQRYQGIANLNRESIKAAKNTKGVILVHNNKVCDTRYSKSCGGITENNENVWNTASKAYLRSIIDSKIDTNDNINSQEGFRKWIKGDNASFCSPKFIPENELANFLGNVDKKGHYFRWEVTYKNKELTNIINSKTNKKFEQINNLIPIKRGSSGRIIELEIKGVTDNHSNFSIIINSEYEIRRILHPEFLYSSAFIVETNSPCDNNENQFTLRGAGWGHGVGLCQIGALGMALEGKKTKEILKHYYQTSKMKNTYA